MSGERLSRLHTAALGGRVSWHLLEECSCHLEDCQLFPGSDPEPFGALPGILLATLDAMRKPSSETKRVTLDIATKKGARELVKLRDEGWEVVSEHKRGTMEWKPGQVDFVFSRTKGGMPAATPMAATSPPPAGPPAGWYPDAQNPSFMRWWDGQRWAEHTQPGA